MDFILENESMISSQSEQEDTAENEDVLFNRIHQQASNLSSGYSTISSGTDQEELIEIQNANIQLILEQ